MAKNKLSSKIFIGAVVVLTTVSMIGLTGVFSPGTNRKSGSPSGGSARAVPCIISEDFHIHQKLEIMVSGEKEVLPANIGVLPGCTREIHTHDTDGVIHVEAAIDRKYTFADFLSVWGVSLQRDGYNLNMTVDGVQNGNDVNFILTDGQEIVLSYE